MTKRLFVGVPLASSVSEEIFSWCETQAPHFAECKQVPKENLHVTLHFLGNVENEKVDPLIQALKAIKFKPFEFEFFRVLGFPSSKKAHVVVLAGSEGTSPFSNLYASIGRALETLKFETEKRLFIPHVTVWRSNTFLSLNEKITFPSTKVKVETFNLYESDTTGKGSRYTVLHTFDS